MKTYVLTLSKKFMKGHPKCGQKTDFSSKFAKGQLGYNYELNKIHTIRCNYGFWKKRIKEVEEGKAILSIREWSDKPYRSKQNTIANLGKQDGVGIQLLDCDKPFALEIDGRSISSREHTILAGHDGLSLEDWKQWFNIEHASGKYAIIHFTDFRY